MFDAMQLLIANWPLIILFFLPVSMVIGSAAAFYAFLLGRIKNRLISYAIPFAIILVWSLWAAAQEIPGPMLAIVNYGYMFLFYPMAVVSLLPLANHFMKLKQGWALALIVCTAVMLVSLTLGGMGGERVVPVPIVPPTYFDNLTKIFVSLLSTMGYAVAGYMIILVIVNIVGWINRGKIKHG